MGPIGVPEMIFIFVLALLLFGPKKLPKLGRDMAKIMGDIRRASDDMKATWNRELAAIEHETRDIHDETHKLLSVPELNETYSTSNNYYDSSYDYGAYGDPDSYVPPDSASATTTTIPAEGETTAQTHAAGDASSGAATTSATAETPVKAVTPEGVVRADTDPAAHA